MMSTEQLLAAALDQAKKFRKLAIEAMSAAIACDNQGYYPQSIVGGEHAYEKRTEAMEAHNNTLTELLQDRVAVSRFFKTLPDTVVDLILDGCITITVNDDKCTMYVDCSDVFFWGCADAEEITVEQIPELLECYKQSQGLGGILWCAKTRQFRPQTAVYEGWIHPDEWPLFDACGPERTDPDGARKPERK
jgi:hypothetical protein